MSDNKKIKTIKDIDTKTEHGRLLFMALAKLTCTSCSDMTPDEVLLMLNKNADKMGDDF